MTPLTAAPRASLQVWHAEQQPVVRALATPMVEEMSRALDDLQEVLDSQQKALDSQQQVLDSQQQVLDGQQIVFDAQQEALDKRDALLADAMKRLTEVQGALEASKEQIGDLTAKVETTTDRIHVLERQMFGRKSEKRKKTPDARKEAKKRRRNQLTEAEKKKRREDAAARRQAKLDALRTVTHTVQVPEAFRQGRQLPPVTSVVYEWHPGELVRVEVSREQWVQPNELAIVTAPPIHQVVEGGIYGPALYAKVVTDKVLNALPLRRQERIYKRMDAPLPMSTLSTLFHRTGALVHVLYEALEVHVKTSAHAAADETPLTVLGDKGSHQGWMWVFATTDALLFTYSATRGKSVPERVLGGSVGTLVVDGYTAYHSVTGDLGRKRGGCWSHARRGLYDALEHDKAFLQPVIDDIGELFYIEELAKEDGIWGTQAHLELRQTKSQPVIDRIFEALDTYIAEVVDGRASVAKAVNYILNQREPLQLFLSEPAVPIHNNLSERALRVVALLRNNSLFAGGDEPAQTYAELLSLLSTCLLHDVDPEAWLADVLLAIDEPGLIAEDLLPWNWKTTRGPKFKPYFDTR